MSDHKGHTRAKLMKLASMHQRAARHYHNLTTHYDCEARDLRVGGFSHAYAMCAAQAHVMAWHYLDLLLAKGPRR